MAVASFGWPHFVIQSLLHRLLRKLYFRIHWRTIVEGFTYVAFGISGVLISVLSSPENFKYVGWGVLILAVMLLGLRIYTAISLSDDPGKLRQRVILGLLVLLHEKLFRTDDFRLTIFIEDPILKVGLKRSKDQRQSNRSEHIIIPYVRHESGRCGNSADVSRAYYPITSRAVTAIAWLRSLSSQAEGLVSDFKSCVEILPRFTSREEMKNHYLAELSVEEGLVKRISDYMLDVVQIFSIPIVNKRGGPIFLLSIDCKKYVNFNGLNLDFNLLDEEEIVDIDIEILAAYLYTLRAVLQDLDPNNIKGHVL